MRRFFVSPDNFQSDDGGMVEIQIRGEDAHHIRNVLRMTVGDHLVLFDGSGVEYESVITALSGDAVRLRRVREFPASNESPLHLAVAQGLLKDKKMDVLVRHLTELGMTRWVPFLADRSIPKPTGAKRRTRAERWEKIANESLKQCGRSRVPLIEPLIAFDDMLAAAGGFTLKLLFWERAVDGLPAWTGVDAGSNASVFIVMGPEGGLSENEVARAREAGFAIVSLGPRILRAETAAISACALVQYRYGDMAARPVKTP